jgi:membrane fusion protein, multidrug efflux system
MTAGRTEAERQDVPVQERGRDEVVAPAAGGTAAAGQKERDEADARGKRRPTVMIGGILVLALLAGAGIYYWLSNRNIVSTDDAYTDGRAVSFAPQVSGQVISLDVTDNQFVPKGQPLVHIDPRQYVNDRTIAQGVLDTAKAQLAGQTFGAEIARKNFPACRGQGTSRLSAPAQLAKAGDDPAGSRRCHRSLTAGASSSCTS